MTEQEQVKELPVVAIVGRPNVGKSAVFNRIAGKRIAIVHCEAGVTRDRLMREVSWQDKRFTLIDTGGIMNIDNETIHDKIDAGIRVQAEAALKDAKIAIFVVDIQQGITPMDKEVAGILYRSGITVYVAANKADTEEFDVGDADFAQLGFPVYPISALHGRGFAKLMDKLTKDFPVVSEEEAKKDEGLCVAIVGRPNAGKSSFVNKLLHAERVLVSDIPGTTRDSIDVPFSVEGRRYTLIDTAGSRREARVDTAVERYSRYRMQESIERADIVVLMIDVERGVGLLDKQLASEIVEQGKGCVVVVNKWDLSTVKEKEYSQTLWQGLPFMSYCPVVFMSAKSGFNVNSVIGAIDYVASQSMATLPTGLLNRVMEEAYNRTPPPSKDGKRMRMYYCVQVGKNPIGIRVFVNDPKRVPASYKSYLINSLREKFGLEGVIVYIQFRARSGGKTADGAESAKKAEKKGAAKKPANRKPVPTGETSMSAMKKRRQRRQQTGYKVK